MSAHPTFGQTIIIINDSFPRGEASGTMIFHLVFFKCFRIALSDIPSSLERARYDVVSNLSLSSSIEGHAILVVLSYGVCNSFLLAS